VNSSKEFVRAWDQGGVTLTTSEVSDITQQFQWSCAIVDDHCRAITSCVQNLEIP
jgi:hypothetical protein